MNPDQQETLAFEIEHAETSLRQLNTRIARLVLTLRLPLRTEEEFDQIVAGTHPLLATGDLSDTASGQKRVHQELKELRGLMVLRCELMTRTLQNLGLELTYQIASQVEEELQREGFHAGADGFYLLRRIEGEHQG